MRLMRVAIICYFFPWTLLCLTRGEPVGRGEGEIMVGGEPKRQLGNGAGGLGCKGRKTEAACSREREREIGQLEKDTRTSDANIKGPMPLSLSLSQSQILSSDQQSP